METEEFYKTKGFPELDKFDKAVSKFDYFTLIEFAEDYAKHIIEINFCDGSPIEFDKLSVEQLKKIHDNINKCVDWVNENN